MLPFGDDRLRRERLVPECEPRGAELVKPAQKIKCQQHFLRCYAPRCISDEQNSRPPQMRPRPSDPLSAPGRNGRNKEQSAAPDATNGAKEGLSGPGGWLRFYFAGSINRSEMRNRLRS